MSLRAEEKTVVPLYILKIIITHYCDTPQTRLCMQLSCKSLYNVRDIYDTFLYKFISYSYDSYLLCIVCDNTSIRFYMRDDYALHILDTCRRILKKNNKYILVSHVHSCCNTYEYNNFDIHPMCDHIKKPVYSGIILSINNTQYKFGHLSVQERTYPPYHYIDVDGI